MGAFKSAQQICIRTGFRRLLSPASKLFGQHLVDQHDEVTYRLFLIVVKRRLNGPIFIQGKDLSAY